MKMKYLKNVLSVWKVLTPLKLIHPVSALPRASLLSVVAREVVHEVKHSSCS